MSTSTTPSTMRAAVLTAPGIENLTVTDVPVPAPRPGWVRIKVMAFGLNRSEYHSVTGQAGGMSYPRVLGIEASGVVDLDPDGVQRGAARAPTAVDGGDEAGNHAPNQPGEFRRHRSQYLDLLRRRRLYLPLRLPLARCASCWPRAAPAHREPAQP